MNEDCLLPTASPVLAVIWFSDNIHLTGVIRDLRVVLIYVFIMANDLKFFLKYLLAIDSPCFENSLFSSKARFF